MERKPKKLQLSRHVVRHLTEPELDQVVGGKWIVPISPDPFTSWLICCISYFTDAWQCCRSTT
jgi:hypothetical protein